MRASFRKFCMSSSPSFSGMCDFFLPGATKPQYLNPIWTRKEGTGRISPRSSSSTKQRCNQDNLPETFWEQQTNKQTKSKNKRRNEGQIFSRSLKRERELHQSREIPTKNLLLEGRDLLRAGSPFARPIAHTSFFSLRQAKIFFSTVFSQKLSDRTHPKQQRFVICRWVLWLLQDSSSAAAWSNPGLLRILKSL